MKVNKRCNNCDEQFDSNKLFYSHIRKCGRPKGQFQCPYCPARNSRKDDLIRRHVVDRHPDKVAEVKGNNSVIEFIRSERSTKAASPSDSDDEFVRKLDSRLGLYVGGDFDERKELNDIIENRPAKQPRSESPMPAQAAPSTPPYEPISSTGEAATAAANLLQVMESMGPPTSPVSTESLSCVAISSSTTSATSSTVCTPSCSTAPVMSILPPQLQIASSMSVQVTTSAPTSLSTIYSPTNPLSLDLPVETPYVPKTLNEMRIEEICRDVAKDTIELYEKKILKNGDPAQRDERCPHGYLLPVHLHRYKRTIAKDGTVTVIREILVNCTQCPAPTIMEVMVPPSRCKCCSGH